MAVFNNNGVAVSEIEKFDAFYKVKNFMYHFIKRSFDICVSLVGIIFLLPIMLFIKIAYMLDKDFEPVLFTQPRIGKDGKNFRFYKFRSMIPNADQALIHYLNGNPEATREYKLNKKLENDPRITKVGKFIRNTSIDELPQLINQVCYL